MIPALRRAGFGTAIATGNWRVSARFKLLSAGIRRGRAPMATADDHEVRAGIIRRALAMSGGRRRVPGAVYVGDRPWDLRAARTLGIGFVGVGSGGQARNLRQAGARECVAGFRNLDAFTGAVVRECARANLRGRPSRSRRRTG